MPWITEQVLLAGAGINEGNWKEVLDLGISAVVNLRTENQDIFGVPLPLPISGCPRKTTPIPLPNNCGSEHNSSTHWSRAVSACWSTAKWGSIVPPPWSWHI